MLARSLARSRISLAVLAARVCCVARPDANPPGFIDTDEAQWIDVNLIQALNAGVDRAVEAANAGGAPRWKAISSHVARFAPHGPCAAEPWTHINATALAAEGNNLPDPPFDSTRRSLADLNTALATLKGAAIGCGIQVMTAGILPGCAAGAGVGLVVGLATNPQESAVSAGMAHPNRLGWQAVGEALFPEFDEAFKRTFTPLPAGRMRQFGASENGNIVVRWDDRSSTETRYEIEIFDFANRTTPVARVTNLPPNSTEFTFRRSAAFVGVARVRACNAVLCSPFTPSVKVTNVRPGVPTNVSVLVYPNETLALDLPDTLVVMGTDPRNADTATRIELTQLTDARGNAIRAQPMTFDVGAPFPSLFVIGVSDGIPAGRYGVRAASCNVFGCSEFARPVESRPAPPGPPELKAELLPGFFVDRLGTPRERPLPSGPPGPGPDPAP